MADEEKNNDRTEPEMFKAEAKHSGELSSEELEKASGGRCWFYHSY